MVALDGSERGARGVVAVLLAGVIAAPALTGHVGVPLSSYPMYAHRRGETVELTVVSARTIETNQARPLSILEISGTRDPLGAQSLLERRVRGGHADALCAEILAGLVPEALVVEIARETHDIVERARGQESVRGRRVVARCRDLDG